MFNVADHLFLLCMFLLHCLFAEKVLSELMQPISDRLDSVRQFTSDIQPSLQYNIVPITDPFGPAVTDSQLDCIVVTTETVLGADRINVKRVEQVWYYHQKNTYFMHYTLLHYTLTKTHVLVALQYLAEISLLARRGITLQSVSFWQGLLILMLS